VKIHGATVLAQADAREGWKVVLVERPGAVLPFVTALWRPGDEEWDSGHYYPKLRDAQEGFSERVALANGAPACRHCGKPKLVGEATCGRGECQRKAAAATTTKRAGRAS
jgi:hypothetical protein